MKGYLVTAAVVIATMAIVFRVPAIRSVVTGQ
jgi:hypothetical protein